MIPLSPSSKTGLVDFAAGLRAERLHQATPDQRRPLRSPQSTSRVKRVAGSICHSEHQSEKAEEIENDDGWI
jgi:pyrroline-5-carboxylate reductase